MTRRPEPSLWQVAVITARENVALVEAMLEGDALSIASFEAVPDGRAWRIEALFDAPPDRETLARAVETLAYRLSIAPLAKKNWIAESRRQLKPVAAGRYYVHGAHDPRHPSPSRIDLQIDAGQAFGTGRHASTHGCLLALDFLAKRCRRPRLLDLGCGSGILALAAARTWLVPVLASDIDHLAVKVARENARLNRLRHLFGAVAAAGFRHPTIRARAPFDIILGNILARPLVRLAPAMRHHLAPGGMLVLSGLLAAQEAQVLNAYRAQRFRLLRRFARDGWHTLLLKG